MKLPEGHGGEVFRLVREGSPTVRTIMITGFRTDMEELVQQAVVGGADAVCYKPCDVDELPATIEQLEKKL